MTYNIHYHAFTQFGSYWVRYHNGTFEVRYREDYADAETKTLFTGHLDECINYVKEIEIADLESKF